MGETITARIPPRVEEKLAEYCAKRGTTRTEAIVRALDDYLDKDTGGEHVAAASIGDGSRRQFLLLTLPTSGGALKVETTSSSSNPVAGIAAAYAGLMDVFKAAA